MRLKCKLSLCPHKPVHAGTHIRTWSGLWGHQYLVHFHCRTFHFFIFYFLFFACTNNTKTQISKWVTFFHSDVFKRIFLFLFAYLRFVLLLGCVIVLFGAFRAFCVFGAFFLFGAFWYVQNLFVKKIKSLKLST